MTQPVIQFYEYGATRSLYANLHIWATNATRDPINVELNIEYFDLESDWSKPDDIYHRETKGSETSFTLLPNQTTELKTLVCPSPPQSKLQDLVGPGIDGSGTVVVNAELIVVERRTIIASYVDWPQPYRYLNIPKPRITTYWLNFRVGKDEATLVVEVDKPVKCLWLDIEPSSAEGKESNGDGTPRLSLSDNAVDIVPEDIKIVRVKGLKGFLHEPVVKTRYLEV
jgi:beta-mannosidase